MENEGSENAGRNGKKQKCEYDLAERTTRFAENIVAFAKQMPRTPVTMSIITQLVKAGTSMGANYREANESVSLREFRNKIGYCKKEANETKYWLRITAKGSAGNDGQSPRALVRGKGDSPDLLRELSNGKQEAGREEEGIAAKLRRRTAPELET